MNLQICLKDLQNITKMKKVIKLTERDLINIIRRVIKEQEVEEDRLDFKKIKIENNDIYKF